MDFIKKKNLPELLAPAGSLEHLKAAVAAGADAVYMGGEKFGARAYAQNFFRKDMIEALQFAHFYERKLYLTVNTLMKEKELKEELGDFLLPYYESGLDGVIVQDMGAVRFIRENFPGIEIHGSTQMTVTDSYGALAAKRMGMTRVVPARELSLQEIKKIKKESGLEVEVFVHGALCYCYSGQCLLSSIYGDRSGNRGRCAQPCRLAYQISGLEQEKKEAWKDKKYFLSPKDLCSLEKLPELMELPVDSLKIEGRMKNVEYVAGVTSIYRKYLDKISRQWEQREFFKPEKEDIYSLEELYCRGSFTKGYWKQHNGKEMMSVLSPKNTGRKIGKILSISGNKVKISYKAILNPKDVLVIPLSQDGQEEIILTVPSKEVKRQPEGQMILNAPRSRLMKPGMPVYRRKNKKLSDYIEQDILREKKKYPVTGDITLKIGEPLMLQLFCQDESVFVVGPIVEASQKRSVEKEDILRQMNKTGNVPFVLKEFEVNIEGNCFLPMSALKNIRQEGFALLEERMKNRGNREKKDKLFEKDFQKPQQQYCLKNVVHEKNLSPEKIASVYSNAQLASCCEDTFFDGICLPWDFFSEEELLLFGKTVKEKKKKVYLALPRVFRRCEDNIKQICSLPLWDGIYAYTINEAEFLHCLEKENKNIIVAASFYEWNDQAVKETASLYPEIIARELPVELSKGEIKEMMEALDRQKEKELTFEVLVYGRVPVMQSAQCLKKTKGCCNHQPELVWLEDRKKRKLPVTTHCQMCYNVIWQDEPRNLIGEDLILPIQPKRHRFDLIGMKEQEIKTMEKEYNKWKQMDFMKNPDKIFDEHHWNFGIE